MILEMSERIAQQRGGMELRLFSSYPFPVRRARVLDKFEVDAIEHFSRTTEGFFTRREAVAGREVMRVAIADIGRREAAMPECCCQGATLAGNVRLG